MPSLHFGYALLVGLTLAWLSRSLYVRVLGLAYPPLVLFVMVATGNHFILDAAAGAAVMLAGIGAAMVVCRDVTARARRRPTRVACPRPRPAAEITRPR